MSFKNRSANLESPGRATPSDPDREGIAALEMGDRDRALRILMRSYGDAIYRFCRSMVGETLADDVHQLTFVHAYRSFGNFRGESSLRSWLYGIARHRCQDALRRQQRHQTHPIVDEAKDPAGYDRLADRDVLEQCLAKLEPKVREAVLLRYVQDLSYPEMGEICGEEPATLQVRVARALPVLRKCIETRSRR